MTTLKDASQIANLEIDKILQKLKAKFYNIDYDSKSAESFYIKCDYNQNSKSEINDIIIRFIPDDQRQNPKTPKNLKEYYNQGGGEKLIEKLKNSDKNAWKCEIFSNLSKGKKMEYGININENNFTKEEVFELFNRYLTEK
jgi:hypothetical protein